MVTVFRGKLLAVLLLGILCLQVATAEGTAREAADTHYALVVANDEQAWAKTFSDEDYEMYQRAIENGIRGHVLEGRWTSARRRADRGVTWKYLRTDKESDSEVKFFYNRLDSNGKKEGYPVPITLMMEDGRWVVSGVTY